ncbi:tellurite resistance protein [Pseudooceanicola batsensis HTCC2597]|uniref:Tellurite resistance protein n=1 Tax=Pseudooceanicola batsensis (strain ATCC BAA-863 / DSM 15984 / KCTC 12145 / HTCC2597) TaxID=252305 RepID=A3U2K5_PSEBH|nr:TrgA family protein [Pseudooceanicola batsensis]EAQ01579.1 tellurite resistance protein [Pseudooceanicola batsensis HTCC2597]
MPTAARIVAAVCIAFVAWVVSGLVKQALADEIPDFGNFVIFTVIVAALCGWTILGRRADRGRLGMLNAIGVGLTAMAMTVFWVLLANATLESFQIGMERRFHDPMKVIYGIYPVAVRYGQVLLETTILTWLVAGGAISGILSHSAGQQWPGR